MLSEIILETCKFNPLAPYVLKRVQIQSSGDVSYVRFNGTNGYTINLARKHAENVDFGRLVLSHEIQHIIFRSTFFQDPIRSNYHIRNIAQDCIINELECEMNGDNREIVTALGGWTLSMVNSAFGQSFNTTNHTWKDVYDFLMTVAEKANGMGTLDDHSQGQESGSPEEGDGAGQDGMDQKIADGLAQQIAQAAQHDEKVRGYSQKTGLLKEYGLEKQKQDVRKFEAMLQTFLMSKKSSTKKQSNKRPNRRIPNYLIGNVKDKQSNVLFSVDVSGSMESWIPLINRAINIALSMGMTPSIQTFNTGEVSFFPDVKKVDNLIKIGGGTDLRCISVRQKDFDAVCVISDYECADPLLDNRNILLMGLEAPKWEKKYKFYQIATDLYNKPT